MDNATQLYFEDFAPGQVYPGQTRTVGQEEFALFARMTGDAHPLHYDEAYARTTRFGKPLAHGLLVVAVSALGATPLSARLEESMVAFVEQDAKFLAPVLAGDTLSTEFSVEDIRPTRSGRQGFVRFAVRITNAAGTQVALVRHTYLIKAR
ncbi:MAG: MaoC family dehydratase [Burkholderiales bacterium]